jgi:hypothetical protein
MPELATKEVVRPLRVIESEIKEILQDADAAIEDAQRPYYQKIGPLLVEARDGHFKGDSIGFLAWGTKKFGKNQETIRRWTALGAAATPKPFKHLEHFAHTPKARGGLGHTPRIPPGPRREWAGPVNEVAERARREAFRLAQEDALTRAQERDAERKLAFRLIDIGYKVLAKELHPDKLDGDRDAMTRLNRVRDKLKHSI